MDRRANQLWRRIFYGMGDIYGAGSFIILNAFYLLFLIDVQKIPAYWAGTIPMIAKIWDSFLDPFMATLSDRAKIRFGQRRFFFIIGAFVTTLTFIFMWTSIGINDVWGRYFYFLILYIGFGTAITIVEIPYNSILPEMVQNYQMRSKFIAWKTIFAIGASIVAGVIPGYLITVLPGMLTTEEAYVVMAIMFGILFGLCWVAVYFGTWEDVTAPIEVVPLRVKDYFLRMLSVFKNRTYRRYFAMYIAGVSSADFIIALFIFFLAVVLQRIELYSLLIGLMILIQFVSIPIYYRISRKFSKTTPILVGLPVWIVGMILAFFVQPSTSLIYLIVIGLLVGFGSASITYTNNLIMPDMSDIDELMTGHRREGIYAGMTFFVRKIAGAAIVGFIGFFLSVIQYDSNAVVQTLATQQALRYFFVFVPIFFMLITFFYARLYSLNESKYNVIMEEVKYRRMHLGQSNASPDTIRICEEVTGMPFSQMWHQQDR